MATSATPASSLNGSSTSAVGGAKGTYDVHTSNGGQENSTYRKSSTPGSNLRQRSTSNLRAPLSTHSSSRKGTNEIGRTTQHRTSERGQAQMDTNDTNGYKNNKSFGALGASERYDDIPENMYKPEKEDLAGWIHREKLAKIENEELQAAGINLAKARSRSRDALSGRTPDTNIDRTAKDNTTNQRDERTPKTSGPLDAEDNEASERMNWDLRTPEEIAADDAAGRVYVSPVLKKSGSKIPILASSPTPIPSERYERETPMPRKRTMSGSISPEDNLLINKTRSGGAEGDTATAGSSSQSGSPTKMRSRSAATSRPGTSSGLKTSSVVRKVSAPTKTISSTSSPPPSNNGRPSTRGNDMDRPRTAVNRPEGDPPWLATMYKPDPRLPPDQQIIPTIAKKQMQEQWALNGQAPKTYDRNFNGLEVHEANGYVLHPSPTLEEPLGEHTGPGLWPLKPPSSPDRTASYSNRPPTSGSVVTGGYSTMPKVTSPPIGIPPSPKLSISGEKRNSSFGPVESRPSAHAPSVAPPPPRTQEQRIRPTTDEEDEKIQKKGCCCIVM